MVRVPKTGSKAAKARAGKTGEKDRKSTKSKREIASSAARHRAPSVADLQAQLERRNIELGRALDRQAATADILRLIASSSDVQPVFEAIAQSAARLCQAEFCNVFRFDGELIHFMHAHGYSREAVEDLRHFYPMRPGRGSCAGRAILNGRIEQIPDVRSDPEYAQGNVPDIMKINSVVAVPMLKEGRPVGAIALVRAGKGNFPQRQIDLLKSFGDQAAIAIENARLFEKVQAIARDLQESLQQQTATSDVLKVISRSAFDLHTVLQTLVESAARLCDADTATITREKAGVFYRAESYNFTREYVDYVKNIPITPERGSASGRALLEGRVVHIPDILADAEFAYPENQRLGGFRTLLGVPMLREGVPLGVLTLSRSEVRPFTDKQIELVTTFADQAAIAIENVRLFDEVQARTRDLQESLRQQTATADVLKVISRSTFDLQTVLHTLVESAARLCEADNATITRQRDGRFYRVESFGFSSEFIESVKDIPVVADRGSASGRALLEGVVVHIPDIQEDPEYTFSEAQRLGVIRTNLGVPMLREGVPVGVLSLTRSTVRPFTEKQIELVKTFADQAAIAIENVRLFDSVEARTRELAASLQDVRSAQDRLIQTEKLASLGQLTAGIAHEIKNPLNFVNNFSALSVELTDDLNGVLKQAAIADNVRADVNELTSLLKNNLDKVVQHGKRADSIVKNMLLHSREGSGERQSADINNLVSESLNLAYHGARAEKAGFSITLRHDLDPEAGALDLHPQEMTRALLNLISNGFYAATRREVRDGTFEPVLSATTRNLGKTVEIRIRDNGTGIPPEVRDKMFNPFFTTKPTGEGTGLGLSMTHDIIVKQHGGRIEVETEPGEFTEFIITLPRETRGVTG